jgi:hypothetical protein
MPDVQRLAEIPGLEELAARLEPARAHLSGAAAVYLDREGQWVFLARLTRLAALVAGGEVENGAAVVAQSPEALARHRGRRGTILELDSFRALNRPIFVNLENLRYRGRRDFRAVGLELVGAKPLVLRGRALYRGDLFRLYVEQYVQAPRRTSGAPLGGLFVEPLTRTWDDLLLSQDPADRERLDRLGAGLARDFNDGRPWSDFLRRAGGAWGVEILPGPAATLWLDLPDADTAERLARMLPKMTADVAKHYRDRGEAAPWELAADGPLWRVKAPRAAELRLGAAWDPAYTFQGARWIFSTNAARLGTSPGEGEGRHLALRIDVAAALDIARACAPRIADATFRDEAELGAASLYAKAFTPDTMASLRRQFPDAAALRKFLDARRSELRARALEEIAKSPEYAEELEKTRAAIEDMAKRFQGWTRVELQGSYGADGLDLEVIAR